MSISNHGNIEHTWHLPIFGFTSNNRFSVLEFETDYETWTKQMEKNETQMRQHVKDQILNFEGNLLTALLLLKRYEQLKFECLALDRRYFEVAIKYGKNIQSLKDS